MTVAAGACREPAAAHLVDEGLCAHREGHAGAVPPRRARAACGSCASGACARPRARRGWRRAARRLAGSSRGRAEPWRRAHWAASNSAQRSAGGPWRREVPWCATLIGLVHGDVQPGVADRLARGGEPGAVAELGEDRDRGQLADPVVAPSAPCSPPGGAHTRAAPSPAARAARSSASIIASATVTCSRAAAGSGCAASHSRPSPTIKLRRCGQPW